MAKRLKVADEVVVNKIYLVRGYKVMLDRDLAVLYGVKAIRLREQVKKKFEPFPKEFYVSTYKTRGWRHGIAKCDTIKAAFGWLSTLRIYRAWNIDVGERFKK